MDATLPWRLEVYHNGCNSTMSPPSLSLLRWNYASNHLLLLRVMSLSHAPKNLFKDSLRMGIMLPRLQIPVLI